MSMSANDSTGGLITASGRSYGRRWVLWICGGSTVIFVATEATNWGLVALRTWLLATLSAMVFQR
jgi:hypothetical protein